MSVKKTPLTRGHKENIKIIILNLTMTMSLKCDMV